MIQSIKKTGSFMKKIILLLFLLSTFAIAAMPPHFIEISKNIYKFSDEFKKLYERPQLKPLKTEIQNFIKASDSAREFGYAVYYKDTPSNRTKYIKMLRSLDKRLSELKAKVDIRLIELEMDGDMDFLATLNKNPLPYLSNHVSVKHSRAYFSSKNSRLASLENSYKKYSDLLEKARYSKKDLIKKDLISVYYFLQKAKLTSEDRCWQANDNIEFLNAYTRLVQNKEEVNRYIDFKVLEDKIHNAIRDNTICKFDL